MRCVITAGPTYEPLDQVRRLTNFSTGTLGCELANYLVDAGCEVDLLLGTSAAPTGLPRANRIRAFTTTADLLFRLEELSSEHASVGAVCHAAAVSDFMFGRIWERDENDVPHEIRSGKLSSRSGSLLAELVPTTKIILRLRSLFPGARLVGWKYEVDGDRVGTVERGLEQLHEAGTDLCVLNGPAYGQGYGLLSTDGRLNELEARQDLFAALLASFEQVTDVRGV